MALSVTNRSARKIGVFAALTMLLGSVVGIGIFFKNHGVLRANDWDGIGVIVAWVLGGIICLAAAVVFSEMGSMRTRGSHGLSGWALRANGKTFGYFHRFNFAFFYYGLLAAVLGVFASEAIVNVFVVPLQDKQPDVWAHIIIGLSLASLFITINYFSAHASGRIQQVTTVLKFIPLIIVALAGVILFTTNLEPKAITSEKPIFGQNAFTNGRGFKFTNMLASLPGVLFAYDAFLGVGSLSSKMIGGEKRVPIIVIVGMLIVITLYTLVGISAAAHGSGLVTGQAFQLAPNEGAGIFDQIFRPEVAKSMGIFVTVFIAVSSLGVLNGISAVFIATLEQAIKTETLFKSKALKKKFKGAETLYVALATSFFWFIAFGIPAIIMKSDAIIDGISNFPTLFSFAMFIPIISGYMLKRQKIETKKISSWLIWSTAAVAVLGIALVDGYQLFYAFSVQAWLDYANPVGGKYADTNWGLFVDKTHMFLWEAYITMASMLTAFFVVPIINAYLIKAHENRDYRELALQPENFEEELRVQTGKPVLAMAFAADAIDNGPVNETAQPQPTKATATAPMNKNTKPVKGTQKTNV